MISIIKPISPNIAPIMSGDVSAIILWLTVLLIAGLSAFFISGYSAERFKSDKKKTALCVIGISVLMTLLMLCFFGCTAIAFKGIIISLVFVLSSFEDIKTRECDDFLHVMIVIAGFIGLELSALPGMLFSALLVFALMVGTLLITKSEIGGADIKMATACAFLLGLRQGLLGLMLGLILAVVINAFKKNKKSGFPMIPYLAVGFMTAYFI